MRAIVVGGAGFIGSNLCERLLNKDYEVICIDNLSSGTKENLLRLMYNPKFTFVFHDITEHFPATNVDYIINCSIAPMDDSLHFFKVCSYGTFTIAGIARRSGAKVINITGINQDYEEKWLHGLKTIELILNEYKQLKVNHICLNNVYGENMSPNSLLFKIIKSLIKEEELTLSDKQLSQKVSHYFIQDAIDVISCVMEHKNLKVENPITIENPVEYTWSEIILILKDLLKANPELDNEHHETDPPLKNQNTWTKTNLNQGLKETIRYVKKYIS